MSVFRVEKNKGYTVMSNHHLRNRTLSLKAKGLLSQMLSLPGDWDYTLQGLAQINKESIDAIREAVRELERAGYIKRSRERDERGCLHGTVYTIYEQPHTEPTPEEPTQEKPALDNPTLEKPMLDKPTLENPTQLNTESTKKRKRQSKDSSITDSIPFPSGFPDVTAQKRTEAKESFERYLLGRIEKRQYPPRMTPHLRREIMKAEIYKARLKFLQENGIATADDLTACMQQAENKVTQLAKQRTILNVRKKKRKKLFDALATEESLAVSKALYEEGLSGMESEYAQYAEAKAVLDACGFSRQTLTEEKADIYEQLAQINKQIRAERQKIKLCREIADSAAVMQRDVAAQEKSHHEKEASQTRAHE